MSLIKLQEEGLLQRQAVGGKAHYLSILHHLEIRIPLTCLIPPASILKSDLEEYAGWASQVAGSNSSTWQLAVRSSAVQEDSPVTSFAGHFHSELGRYERLSLLAAIERVRSSGPAMTVILQPLIDAAYSGVAFSCNPLTYSRHEIVVNWTSGLAGGLLAGELPGHVFRMDLGGSPTEGQWPNESIARGIPRQLADVARTVQEHLDGPVDLEWAIDRDGCLWLLQARPVVLPIPSRVNLTALDRFAALAPIIRTHPKVRLRRHAIETGVPMAPATVETCTALPPERTEYCPPLGHPTSAVSIVLLYPERVDDRIVRAFAPTRGGDIRFFITGCRRYSIRRYPEATAVASTNTSILTAGLKNSWVAASIQQEIWPAFATGILRRSIDGYVIDIALGHFVPKGIVTASTLVVSHAGEVLTASWRHQESAFHFVDGHVVEERPPSEQLTLTSDQVRSIVKTLAPMLRSVYEDSAIEFGLLGNPSGSFSTYVIDAAEGDAGNLPLSTAAISAGVISEGTCRGQVATVELTKEGALDRHFFDRVSSSNSDAAPSIIVALRPSIELLPLVNNSQAVGFIFHEGALLCHLAVVLRERGIPALVGTSDELALLQEGAMISVSTAGSTPRIILQTEVS